MFLYKKIYMMVVDSRLKSPFLLRKRWRKLFSSAKTAQVWGEFCVMKVYI